MKIPKKIRFLGSDYEGLSALVVDEVYKVLKYENNTREGEDVDGLRVIRIMLDGQEFSTAWHTSEFEVVRNRWWKT